MTKAKYATPEERWAATSMKAKAQMLAQWERQRKADGAEVSYSGRHRRVRTARGRAGDQLCVECQQQARDWAQFHGTTGENPADYQPMCKSCHFIYDDVSRRSKETLGPVRRSEMARKAWETKRRNGIQVPRPCEAPEGCTRKRSTRLGLCQMHYKRVRRAEQRAA